MAGDVSRILNDNKALILAFDQGLEHPPNQFNPHTIDPAYVLNIALEGEFTAVACHAGIAEKYLVGPLRNIPLIIKLNGKSEWSKVNPYSMQICSVERAVKLGAEAVGYTIYDGSESEPEMFAEFGDIVEEAHSFGIPVIAWMYPRGSNVKGMESDSLAYAARIALELGADFVKIKHNGDDAAFDWIVQCAGRTKVLLSDPKFKSDEELLEHVYAAIKAGATGVALGRTIWQHPRPFSLAKALRAVIFENLEPKLAIKELKEHL